MRQNIAGWCQQTFCFQKYVDNDQQRFAFKVQHVSLVSYLNIIFSEQEDWPDIDKLM